VLYLLSLFKQHKRRLEKTWVYFATSIYGKNLMICQVEMAAWTGRTHLIPNREKMLHNGGLSIPETNTKPVVSRA